MMLRNTHYPPYSSDVAHSDFTLFPKVLWLTLAKRHLESKNIDLKKAFSVCLSERSDPEDAELGTQIIKDLHRTGCSPFSGDVAEQNQSHLKRVLLGYARWNPNVGYCQGFNMLAAIILEAVEWVEEDALMVEVLSPDNKNRIRSLQINNIFIQKTCEQISVVYS
ncbi:TBC1 domain family member 30 [Trichonephila clavipes]|nr:TBC1 domain family member 30 [Trichonephila clavipes]